MKNLISLKHIFFGNRINRWYDFSSHSALHSVPEEYLMRKCTLIRDAPKTYVENQIGISGDLKIVHSKTPGSAGGWGCWVLRKPRGTQYDMRRHGVLLRGFI